MLITTIPIVHIIKHHQPIFCIDKNSNYFAPGGMNGEVKLWANDFTLVKTIKKHSGSVSSVRFSKDGNFLASSGDDGKLYIYDQHCNDVLAIIRHKCDITHVEWTPELLISVDMDGVMIITKIVKNDNQFSFLEFRKIVSHENSILGLAVKPKL